MIDVRVMIEVFKELQAEMLRKCVTTTDLDFLKEQV